MRRRATGWTTAILLTAAGWTMPAALAQTDAADAARFVGAWEYVRSETLQDDGTWQQMATADGRTGLIMYTASGHMSVHIMRHDREARDSEGYTAYFGTYHVDVRDGLVIHRRTGNISPNGVGTDARRGYAFADDTLTLTVAPANRARLVWRRLQ